MLADFKKWTLERLNTRLTTREAQLQGLGRHIHMYLDQKLSPLLGLAGAEAQMQDPLVPQALQGRNLMNDFLQLYQPHAIIEWLKAEMPARQKPEVIYGDFGIYMRHWVENNMEAMARIKGITKEALEAEYEEDFDWIVHNLFAQEGGIATMGIQVLLIAAGAIQDRRAPAAA